MNKFDLSSVQIACEDSLSIEAKNLIWEIFFESRLRGINIDYHFPWINEKINTTSITVKVHENNSSKTIAVLVIKKIYLKNYGMVGLIGLVCVHEKYRGYSLSKILMSQAISYGHESSLNALILWTTKPGVYAKSGFIEDSVDLYGTATRAFDINLINNQFRDEACIKAEDISHAGVPAFAKSVIKYSLCDDFILVCKNGEKHSLIDWQGKYENIIILINKFLPKVWNISIPVGSKLIPKLKKSGYSLDLNYGSRRMIYSFMKTPESIPHIEFMKRI